MSKDTGDEEIKGIENAAKLLSELLGKAYSKHAVGYHLWVSKRLTPHRIEGNDPDKPALLIFTRRQLETFARELPKRGWPKGRRRSTDDDEEDEP